MAITGLQTINIGLQNESVGSDSLYAAFTKTKNNFANLFACASPYNNFIAGNGISTNVDTPNGNVTINNTGVTSIIAGTGVTINNSTGAVTISANGGGNGGGTVTSVGLIPASISRLQVTNSPIVSAGNMTIDLVTTGVSAGTYTYPTVSVDAYGRVTSISNANSVGTVTSVGITAGAGISVTGGPITSNGSMTVTNTGVTRLSAGTGIVLSGTTGNVTISTTPITGAVTSIGISSSTLTVSGSPIVSAGTININLPANVPVTGNLTVAKQVLFTGSEDVANGAACNLETTASYFSTGATGETSTLAAGTAGQIKTFMMVADGGGDMVITVTNAGWKTTGTGTMTFGDIGDAVTLQYIASKWFCIGNNGVVFA